MGKVKGRSPLTTSDFLQNRISQVLPVTWRTKKKKKSIPVKFANETKLVHVLSDSNHHSLYPPHTQQIKDY